MISPEIHFFPPMLFSANVIFRQCYFRPMLFSANVISANVIFGQCHFRPMLFSAAYIGAENAYMYILRTPCNILKVDKKERYFAAFFG